MISKKIVRKLIDKKQDLPEKYSRIKALSKFDFARVMEFVVREFLEANKKGREPNIDAVSKYVPDIGREILEEFFAFTKDLFECWKKHGDKLDVIMNCLKGEKEKS